MRMFFGIVSIVGAFVMFGAVGSLELNNVDFGTGALLIVLGALLFGAGGLALSIAKE